VTQQETRIPEARTPAGAAAADGPVEAVQAAGGGRLAALRGWSPTAKQVEWACFAALLANTLIVVTGGAVRLTNSGLGCPTWPSCTDGC
jgi:cytochrome c oxidase assembly protein subunit 15